jgi:NAD(P)H-flavin reductase
MSLTIITNHHEREVLSWWELTDQDRRELDYITADREADFAGFRYRGEVYDLAEFERWDNPASVTRERWDGFRSDSYFSGVAVRFADDFEAVIVALVLA